MVALLHIVLASGYTHRYSNGDIHSGHWVKSQRSGFGRLEETSRKSSLYTGAWENDKRHGYGVYEDKMK